MSWIDILRMSGSNLKKRKLRTFLTVLGVIIGTTSIVVMISLGLGMQQAIYQEIEQSGGLNTITVTGTDHESGMVGMYGESGQETDTQKRITDEVVEQFGEMEHVVSSRPVYAMQVVLLKNGLESYSELIGMTPEGLKEEDIELAPGGSLPKTGTSTLELVYGNGIITSFSDKNGNSSYYETGELPDFDLSKDSLFLILDGDGYMSGQQQMPGPQETGEEGEVGSAPSKPPRKYPVRASGVTAGDVDAYTRHYYNIYCDLDTLKVVLKKEFAGSAIPGQPVGKSGRPYKDFTYSYAKVKVDDIDAVDQVASWIREMGYNTETNGEYMESAKSQLAIIQAVLGGIGAVSLLVAAIGIANTMMMSIYERTKEIGVMKVLGCSLSNICQMFLAEAALIGVIGGAFGSVLSGLLSYLINVIVSSGNELGIDGNLSYIPPWLVLAAVAFAMFVGIAAGYFPALRAMRLSPLAAIRNE